MKTRLHQYEYVASSIQPRSSNQTRKPVDAADRIFGPGSMQWLAFSLALKNSATTTISRTEIAMKPRGTAIRSYVFPMQWWLWLFLQDSFKAVASLQQCSRQELRLGALFNTSGRKVYIIRFTCLRRCATRAEEKFIFYILHVSVLYFLINSISLL
jgi:hypothetical protein